MTRDSADDKSRERLVETVRGALGVHDPEPARLAAMRAHIAATSVRGGTTLREGHRWPRWWIAGTALAAAAAALILLVVFPTIDRRTTVSAAEILGRSRSALSAPASGVEVLTYDLTVDGVLSALLPSEQTGRLTVEETIDHDHPGRYRLRKLAEDGEVVGAIADDSVRGTRARYVRAHGRGYLLRFTSADATAFSLPAVKRMVLQAFITMLQTTGDPALREIQRDGEACYEITIPQADGLPDAVVSLSHARALITAADARLVEFSAAGQIAQRPFGIEFALRTRELRPASSVTDADFDIAARPGDIILQGSASSNPMWDVVERVLAAIPPQPSR